jgi:RNA polymerase sigma factor (sigma-70 family)
MATLGRGDKYTQPAVTNEEIFRRLIDLNVIDDMAMLKEFSRQAGIVLRHHPDYEMRRQAAGMLIFCNERMAQKIARKYHNRWKNFGFSMEDMFQEAQIGLAEAAEDRDGKRRRVWEDYRRALAEWEESGQVLGKTKPKPPKESDVKVFDPDKASFLTFAMQKINMRIGRMVEHNSEQRFGHRVSTEKFHQVGKVLYEKGLLEVKQNDDVTAEMLLRQPGMTEFEPDRPQKERLALCQDCLDLGSTRSVRLNERVRNGEESEYTERGALIPDQRQNTESAATDNVVNQEMKKIMKGCLNDEEMHYIGAIDLEGMYGEWPAASSDDELAQRLGVKPSRVKSIRKEARKKLRSAMKTAGWDIPS